MAEQEGAQGADATIPMEDAKQVPGFVVSTEEVKDTTTMVEPIQMTMATGSTGLIPTEQLEPTVQMKVLNT